jgi:glutamyl-tRNA synthetase
LMGVSLVIRGDEWISSTPIHLQLFEALGMPMLPIAHVAPVAKQDGDSRRKLSKRLDVEAAMSYYHERGYPSQSILEYLLNLLDSDFERWRGEQPAAPIAQFQLSVDHLGRSSPLFDLAKLSNVSRDVVARFTADELFAEVLSWATEHDPTLASALRADPAYGRRALDIGRDATPPRKDIVKWSDVPARFGFFFAPLFDAMVPACYAELPALAPADAIGVVDHALDTLAAALATDGPTWHAALKAFALANGYAGGAGAFKRDPTAFKGTVGDVAMLLRVAITGSRQSPDLHAVMQILGEATVRDRLERVRSHVLSSSPR